MDLSQTAKGKGKMTIHFNSHEEFERLRQIMTATMMGTTQTYSPQQQFG